MNRFREARLRAGLSQKAAAISLGIKPPSMSDWENGKSMPTYNHLQDMAKLYNVSINYLLNKEKPVISDDGLKESTIERIKALPEPVLEKLLDLMDAVQSYQEDGSAAPAARGPSDQSSPG